MFEKFIDVCLEYYGLDPCHCFSSPKLAWDAMLKMTGVKLELISDIDMHLFIEKDMSGGGGGGVWGWRVVLLIWLKDTVEKIISL